MPVSGEEGGCQTPLMRTPGGLDDQRRYGLATPCPLLLLGYPVIRGCGETPPARPNMPCKRHPATDSSPYRVGFCHLCAVLPTGPFAHWPAFLRSERGQVQSSLIVPFPSNCPSFSVASRPSGPAALTPTTTACSSTRPWSVTVRRMRSSSPAAGRTTRTTCRATEPMRPRIV